MWSTDRWGKWAENHYESPLYPPFACGSGYVLSFDLIQWIASNINHLHRFQVRIDFKLFFRINNLIILKGEDVSLGIWMSALNPRLKEVSLSFKQKYKFY